MVTSAVQGDVRSGHPPNSQQRINMLATSGVNNMMAMMESHSGTAAAAEMIQITFKVNYKTEYGECLSMVGETEQTGCWKDFSAGMMKWTNDDWWTVTLSVNPRIPFMYKYVVIDHASR